MHPHYFRAFLCFASFTLPLTLSPWPLSEEILKNNPYLNASSAAALGAYQSKQAASAQESASRHCGGGANLPCVDVPPTVPVPCIPPVGNECPCICVNNHDCEFPPKPECTCPCTAEVVCCCEPKVQYCCKLTPQCQTICLLDMPGLEGETREDLFGIAAMIKQYQRFQANGSHIPRFILLTGPYGVDLNAIARAIAGEACVPLFQLPCNGKDKAACIRGVIKEALLKCSPVVILLEDVDKQECLFDNDCIIPFKELQCRDIPIVIIATARCIHKVPQSFLLPRRFDIRIALELPSLSARLEILTRLLREVQRDTSISIPQIAAQTDGYSPEDLESLVNLALLCASSRFSTILADIDIQCARARLTRIMLTPRPLCCPRPTTCACIPPEYAHNHCCCSHDGSGHHR